MHIERTFKVDGTEFNVLVVLKAEIRQKKNKQAMASSARLEGYLKDEIGVALNKMSPWFDPKDSETLEEL